MNSLRLSAFSVLPAAALAVASLMSLSSCSESLKIEGSWAEVAPENVTSQFPSASDVTALRSLTFMNGERGGEGTVNLSTTYTVTRKLVSDSVMAGGPVDMHFVVTASVDGTWSVDVDDQDDLLLNFNYPSIDVQVDPGTVTFSNPMVKNDSVANAEIEETKKAVSIAFRDAAARFSTIEDVEVKNGGSLLTLEVNSRQKDLTFRKVEP